MHWREPIETIQARERFWNQPRITVPIMLAVTALGAVGGALLGSLAVRILTGDWHWPIAPLLGAIFGGFFGLAVSYPQRIQVRRRRLNFVPMTFRCGTTPKSVNCAMTNSVVTRS